MFPSFQKNNIHKIIFITTQNLELLEENIMKYFPALKIQYYGWV